MRIITRDDLRDILLKGQQRGWDFIRSKFAVSAKARTTSAFNASADQSSNWWDINYIQQHWNKKITGKPSMNYKEYLIHEVLKDRSELKLLSLGSGICKHEIEFAKYNQFSEITCLDLSEYRMEQAAKQAAAEKLNNMKFICADMDSYRLKENYYDCILFNSSLHHFKNVDALLSNKIKPSMKPGALIIINEFVGPTRLQFPKHQINAINDSIKTIPIEYRQRYKSKLTKSSYSGSGILRMILADPSECIDSAAIMPALHRHFKTVIEKPYGGNLLMNVLKDIAHHFIELDSNKQAVLDKLIQQEEAYLKNNPSDFVFGVYSNS